MEKDLLDLIAEELFLDNIDTEKRGDTLYWKDNMGAENLIEASQTASSGNLLAWWQQNEVGKDMVKLRLAAGVFIHWRPPLKTMGMSYGGCSLLRFYQNRLVVAYRDKHKDRVFTLHTETLAIEEVGGEYLEVNGIR